MTLVMYVEEYQERCSLVCGACANNNSHAIHQQLDTPDAAKPLKMSPMVR